MTDQEIIRRVTTEVMRFEIDPDPPWYGNQLFIRRNGEKTYWGFNPLTNLNHAFMVVEKMRKEGWYLKASIKQGSLWCVLFEQYPALEPYIDIFHENLGHAICLAALKAMEAKL